MECMALALPHSIFYHIPKTGGTWVRRVIAETSIPSNEIVERSHFIKFRKLCQEKPSKNPFKRNAVPTLPTGVSTWLLASIEHVTPHFVEANGRFQFAFVRHPLSLYQSFWRYKMTEGWDMHNALESKVARNTFAGFVEAMLTEEPGWLSKKYRSYTTVGTRKDPQDIDFIGKQEHLVEDLITALTLAGEEFDPAIIRNHPPVNVTRKKRSEKDYALSSELQKKFRKIEAEAFERYGYDDTPSVLE